MRLDIYKRDSMLGNKPVNPRRAIAILAIIRFCLVANAQDMPRMTIGMNTGWHTYWTKECAFIDVMKSSGSWVTYQEGGGWNAGVYDSLDLDKNGYPTVIPQIINGAETRVRILINNHYKGRYVLLYDGEGDFEWHVPHDTENGKDYLTLDGTGGVQPFCITRSVQSDHRFAQRFSCEPAYIRSISSKPWLLAGFASLRG
jgi:hypothetical protein